MSASESLDAELPFGRDPDTRPGSSDLEAIEAELADHLACAGAEAQRAGLSPAEARREANLRFGDARRIARQCWWIQQGDQIMWKSLQTVLLSVICLGIVALVVTGWRWQRAFSEQLEALTQKLSAAGQTPPAETTLREIRGIAFVGDPAKPAVDAKVEVLDFHSGKKVRTVYTDNTGRFHTGVLPEGEYALLVPFITENNLHGPTAPVRTPATNSVPLPLYYLQTNPIAVQSGLAIDEERLNLELPVASITWELSGRLSDVFPTDRLQKQIRLQVAPVGHVAQLFPLPLDGWRPIKDWPQIVMHGEDSIQNLHGAILPSRSHETVPAGIDARTGEPWPWPPGEYAMAVWLTVENEQVNSYRGTALLGNDTEKERPPAPWASSRLISTLPSAGMGRNYSHPPLQLRPSDLLRPGVCLAHINVKVIAGYRTHLRLVLDDGFESAVQRVLPELRTDENIVALSKFARLEVVGVYPLAEAAKK